MSKPKPTGFCCICGAFGPLSYEHIPPEAAFNDQTILEANVEQLIAAQTLKERDEVKKRTNQRGAGGYTLCRPCNSNTGAWYVPAYIRWAKQGVENLSRLVAGDVEKPLQVEPLFVAKQIMAMFASACGPEFFRSEPDLVRFVLNQSSVGLSPGFRIWAYYLHPLSQGSRQSGVTANLDLDGSSTPRVHSEIAFPPFGYVLAFNDTKPPDPRMVDITFMAHESSPTIRTLNLKLPLLQVNSFLPGDYRSKAEIDAAFS